MVDCACAGGRRASGKAVSVPILTLFLSSACSYLSLILPVVATGTVYIRSSGAALSKLLVEDPGVEKNV